MPHHPDGSPTEGTPLTSMLGVHEIPPEASTFSIGSDIPMARTSLSPVLGGGPRPTSMSHVELEMPADHPPPPTPAPTNLEDVVGQSTGMTPAHRHSRRLPPFERNRAGSVSGPAGGSSGGEEARGVEGHAPPFTVNYSNLRRGSDGGNSVVNPIAPPASVASMSRQTSAVSPRGRAGLRDSIVRRGSGGQGLLFGVQDAEHNNTEHPPVHAGLYSEPTAESDAWGMATPQDSTIPTPYGSKWQRFVSFIKAHLPEWIEWSLQPAHTAIIILCIAIFVAGSIITLVMLKWVKVEKQLGKDISEICSQILCYIFTLNALANHPQRFVWLHQKIFRAKDNRKYFDRYFPFDLVWGRRTWICLLLLHVNCFAQYAVQTAMTGWGPDNRPNVVVYVGLVVSMIGGCAGAGLHQRWRKQYMQSKCLGSSNTLTAQSEKMQSYEAMLVQARLLHQHDWRVTIRVERPGQPPLQYSTTNEAYGGNPVTTYYARV